MNTPARTETVLLPPPDEREILRYAGGGGTEGLPLADCLAELGGLRGRVCFREYDIRETPEGLDLGFAFSCSADLQKALSGCGRLLLFAATIGFAPDRLIARYGRVSPARALLFQAIGSERAEALCDTFCARKKAEYAEAGCELRPRFSPGYGDLPLSLQKEVFAALDLPRTLGITLGESLLMMPSKSVTALAGIRKKT